MQGKTSSQSSSSSRSGGKRGRRKRTRSAGRAESGGSKNKKSAGRRSSTQLSARTRKQIDDLPQHAQRIFKKAHANAVRQYRDPEKRRSGRRQSVEEVAHKVAWSAVKKEYEKNGGRWTRREGSGEEEKE